MLKSVKLYGELAEKYGKDWSLDVESPREAFQALAVNNPGFLQFISTSEQRGVGYTVKVGKSYLQGRGEELANPVGRQEIKIIPIILGAKNQGLMMVLVGAAIIFAPYLITSMQYGTALMGEQTAMLVAQGGSGGALMGGLTSGIASKFGGALVLGGIASMMAPTPSPLAGEKAQNYAFNGAANTTRQGVAIPVCYGQLMVGGAVISSGISPEDYVPEPESDDE
jgi:predicted phage tail protein